MTAVIVKVYKRILKHPFLLLLSACLLSALIFDYSADNYTPFFVAFLCIAVVLLTALMVYWKSHGGLTEGRIVFLITAAAFIVKLAYVLYTGLGVRQHDIGTFRVGSKSHSGYIFRLYSEQSFPDSVSGQYYHPPLHYIIEAVWLKLQTALGASFETAQHYVTALTLFYSCASGYISYKIFKELNLNKKAACICYATAALHPAFIIFAASYNNDCLSVTLMLFALLYLIRWWKNPTFFNIIMVAFGIGFGMMTKLSAVYIAPAAAAVFLIKFLSEKQKLKKVGEFAVFGAIAIPAGTWWSFRILYKFQARLGYVMRLGTNHDQYVGFHSVSDRLFNLFGGLSEGIYFARGENFGNTCHEYNIPSAVLKTSVFGEWHMGEGLTVTEVLAYILFIVNIIVIAASLFCMLHALFKKYEKVPNALKACLYVLYVSIMGTYVNFCFTHAHDCTMDFRYIVPAVVIGAAFMGMFISDETESRFKTYIKKGIIYASAVFCVCSALLYLLANYAAN
ncbi:MAG: glycosyltransferase family 39 protein [Eubacteriales bacterium]|nr:glycosyltransferase family 39 protein [Eubacteriales bacterium]